MNLLFTICARAGSKGVKSKNTRLFCGVPLVHHTLGVYLKFIKQYGESFESIKLAVNTDSLVLLEQIEKTNIDYIKTTRKKSMAGDTVSKMDVIRDTLQQAEIDSNRNFDFIIDLDITSPLRRVDDIKGTLDCIIQLENADLSFSVTESRRNPYFNMVNEKDNGFFDTVMHGNYVSRQQTPICYDMNASIYAYRRKYLQGGNTHERCAGIWLMKDTGILDIDSEEDLKLLEVIASYFIKYEEGYNNFLPNGIPEEKQ